MYSNVLKVGEKSMDPPPQGQLKLVLPMCLRGPNVSMRH